MTIQHGTTYLQYYYVHKNNFSTKKARLIFTRVKTRKSGVAVVLELVKQNAPILKKRNKPTVDQLFPGFLPG